MEVNQYLLGRLSIDPSTSCAFLDRLTIAQVVDVLRRLGAAALLGKRDDVNVSVGKLDEDLKLIQSPLQVSEILCAGFEYARDGRESLRRLIERLAGGQVDLRQGLTNMVGAKLRNWIVHRDNPLRGDFGILLGSRSARNGQSPPHLLGKTPFLHELETSRFKATVSAVVPDGELERRRAIKLGLSTGELMTLDDCAAQLDVPVTWVKNMIETGLLNPAWYDHRGGQRFIYKQDVDCLVDQLASAAGISRSRKGRNSLTELPRICRTLSISIVIARIISQRIVVKRDTSKIPRLSSIWVHPQRDWMRAGKIQLSQADIAGLMHITADDVDELARRNYLQQFEVFNRKFFEADTFIAFNSAYLSLSRLAKMCSWPASQRGLHEIMKSEGVEEVLGEDYTPIFRRPVALRAFYNRTDINEFLHF